MQFHIVYLHWKCWKTANKTSKIQCSTAKKYKFTHRSSISNCICVDSSVWHHKQPENQSTLFGERQFMCLIWKTEKFILNCQYISVGLFPSNVPISVSFFLCFIVSVCCDLAKFEKSNEIHSIRFPDYFHTLKCVPFTWFSGCGSQEIVFNSWHNAVRPMHACMHFISHYSKLDTDRIRSMIFSETWKWTGTNQNGATFVEMNDNHFSHSSSKRGQANLARIKNQIFTQSQNLQP